MANKQKIEDLEAKVKRLKQQAKERNYNGRAIEIAKIMHHGNVCLSGNTYWKYYDEGFDLTVEHTCGNYPMQTSIEYKDKRVFWVNMSCIQTYIPGRWEEGFEQLYSKAKKIEAKREIAKRNEEEARLKDNFGV